MHLIDNPRPLVSVIVPAYNRQRYVDEAMQSVVAQDYSPIELIVVDDGSTDGTAERVRACPAARLISQPNAGPAAARNAGVAASHGELLAFLDSDDLWLPQKLTLQVGYLRENADVGYCIGGMQNFLEPGCELPAWIPAYEVYEPKFQDHSICTLVVRREIFQRVGGFNPTYTHGEDTDWFVRAKDAGIRPALLREVLMRRRLHDSNLMASRTEPQFRTMARIIKESLERRRRAGDFDG